MSTDNRDRKGYRGLGNPLQPKYIPKPPSTAVHALITLLLDVPSWLKVSPDQVEDQICKLARKGATPSQIGVLLRDSHGIAQTKIVTGNKILRILKSNGLAPSVPEDLFMLIRKAVSVRKHLERNKKDKDSKFRLILIESRIHRLSRYYKSVGVLPPTWKYESATASTLVS
ncbi:MAG: ribosomal 40S subunit protein S13 [Chrysothrix sp. TS-e1954]|nr:MAG: ribosomal 40S subunit protein S13 [Chrysothrix sp. TS-e1954]